MAEQMLISKTLDEAIEESFDRLPAGRAFVQKARWHSARYRRRVRAEIQEKMMTDPEACACGFNAVFATNPGGETVFTFDPEKWDQFFALIVKWLPQIIEIIMAFLQIALLVGAGLLALAAGNQVAFAHDDGPPDITGLSATVDRHTAEIVRLDERLSLLETQLARAPAPASKAPASKAPVTDHYKARWVNKDGLSFEEHARIMHGIDTTGMTYAEIARARDADHDRYGGGHNFVATRTSVPGRTVQRSVSKSFSSCPGDVCPTSSSSRTVTRANSGGWYLGKLLGR